MALAETFPTIAGLPRGEDRPWIALVIAMALLSGVTFACVTPFAAFAVLIAATLPLSRGLAAIAAVWLANQALGFLALGYPFEAATLAWGVVIGIAALGATLAAAAAVRAVPGPTALRIAVGFAAAFVAYEAVLLLATPVLGGVANFAPAIVAKLALSDACWLIGIAILRHVLLRIEWSRRTSRHPVTT